MGHQATELVLFSHERCGHCGGFRSRIEGTDIRQGPFCGPNDPIVVELPTDWSMDSWPPTVEADPVAEGHDEIDAFLDEHLG